MYAPRLLPQFKKDYQRETRSGRSVADIDQVIRLLIGGDPLQVKYRDHPLKGAWSGFRECHARPDLLIIYQVQESRLVLVRMGSHAELFE